MHSCSEVALETNVTSLMKCASLNRRVSLIEKAFDFASRSEEYMEVSDGGRLSAKQTLFVCDSSFSGAPFSSLLVCIGLLWSV